MNVLNELNFNNRNKYNSVNPSPKHHKNRAYQHNQQLVDNPGIIDTPHEDIDDQDVLVGVRPLTANVSPKQMKGKFFINCSLFYI